MRASDEDYDHEVEANLTEEEQNEFNLISDVCSVAVSLLCVGVVMDSDFRATISFMQVAHLIRVLFGKLKTHFLPYFDTILHAFTAMLVCPSLWCCSHSHVYQQPTRPIQDKQWALCIFDDLIEFTEGV